MVSVAEGGGAGRNEEQNDDDHDDDDDITTKTNVENTKSERVRLVSISKQGSGKETVVSDKERMKAGMMTTNKKVCRWIKWSLHCRSVPPSGRLSGVTDDLAHWTLNIQLFTSLLD